MIIDLILLLFQFFSRLFEHLMKHPCILLSTFQGKACQPWQLFFLPFLFSVFLGQTVFFDCLLLIFHSYLAEMKLVWCEVNGAGRHDSPQGRLMDFFTTSKPTIHCTALYLIFILLTFLSFHNFLLFFLFQTKHSL